MLINQIMHNWESQVFEHIDHPFKSALTIRKLLAPNGLLYFTVPFLQRYHIGHISEDPHFPQDQYRWAPCIYAMTVDSCQCECE